MRVLEEKLQNLDRNLIKITKLYALPFARFSIFVIYLWFGLLKIFSASPANPLVSSLLSQTMPLISFQDFIVFFGIFEVLIGIILIIPRLERLGILLLILHLVTTVMPLFLLPEITWQSFLVPTLEGQYIIKNILIVALAIGIFAHLHSLKPHQD